MVQCARICFGLGRIIDQDEAERVSSSQEGYVNQKSPTTAASNASQLSGVMLKPFGTSQLNYWIQKPRQYGGHAS